MTTPQATTYVSESQKALIKLFENWARESFEKSMNSANEVNFYQSVKKKLEAKIDMTDDLPALKKVKTSAAKAVVKDLAKQAKASVDAAWVLPSNIDKLFRTTIRSQNDESSLMTCFDVEYKAETERGYVKIAIKTWRLNLSVTVDGAAEALDLLQGQLVMTGLQAARVNP